mmetsp:Transcript_32902/g.75764  ORF Transcript_32902/g.75764 Transcript_32902/m.75764 type:complete len:334 (+) Transcript_32902:300-1301(+)
MSWSTRAGQKSILRLLLLLLLVVVVLSCKFRLLGFLLLLDALLAFGVTELGLALVGFVGRKVLLLGGARIFTNSFVDSLVHFLQTIGLQVIGKVGCKVLLVLLVIFLIEVFHVFSYVSSKDAFTMHVGIVLLGVPIVSRKTFFGMGNVQTSIGGTLEGTKDAIARSGGLAADVQEATEGALVLVDLIHIVLFLIILGTHHLTIDFCVSLVGVIQSELLQETPGDQQSRAVGSSVVLESDLESIAMQFLRVGLAEDTVTIHQGVHDLADHLTIGEAHHQTVFGGLVLVLVLATETLALTVIGLALPTTAKLDLITGEVGLVFLDFDKHHGDKKR